MPSPLRTKTEQNSLLLTIREKARSFAIGEVSEDAVDDITTEVVLHCLAKLRSRKWKKLPKNPQALVRKLTSDHVADFYRRRKAERLANREYRRARRMDEHEWMQAELDWNEGAISEFQAAVIRTLPAQCRMAYELVRVQEASYKEAAECMGVTIATIRNHIVYAHRRFREAVRTFDRYGRSTAANKDQPTEPCE